MTLEQRARNVRQDLFSRYDQLNALWQRAEEQLKKHHIPRPVFYDFPRHDYDRDNQRWTHCLGLCKINGDWRICYGTHPDCDPESLEMKPIVECSVEIRVEAVKHLPRLREAAIESAEKFVPEVDKAIQRLSEALGGSDDIANLLAERAKMNGKPQ